MMEKETLEQKTLMELRTMAKEMGLGPISALKKRRSHRKNQRKTVTIFGEKCRRCDCLWFF